MSGVETMTTPARRQLDADRLLTLVCVGLPLIGLVLFFLYPMVIVFLRSLTVDDGYGLANYTRVLGSTGFWRATEHSLIMGAATTVLSVFLGFIIAHGLYRCAFRGKWLIRGVIVLPLLAPSLVQALGLIFLLGRNGVISRALGVEIEIYGFWGLLIANTLYALPQAVMIIGAALVLLDARVYEAAEVMGASPSRQFRDLTLPAARRDPQRGFRLLYNHDHRFRQRGGDRWGLLGSGDRNLLSSGRPAEFQHGSRRRHHAVVADGGFLCHRASGDEAAAGRADGWPGTVSALLRPRARPGHGVPVASGLHRHRRGYRHCRLRKLCHPLALQHGAVVQALRHHIGRGYSSLWMTIVISLMAASGGTLAVFLLCLGLRRLPRSVAQPIQMLAAMPAAVPGMVLGLAYILTFNSTATPLYLLYGTAALIAIINFYHYHTQGFLTVMTGFRQLPRALEEAADSLGAGMARTAVDIVAPFIAPMLVSVFFFLFMRSMVTLSAVVFLTTPDLSVAAVTIMRLDDAGLTSQAAAFSTCVMAVVCIALLSMKGTLVLMGRGNRSKVRT